MANRNQRLSIAASVLALLFFTCVCAVGSLVGLVLALIRPRWACSFVYRLPFARVWASFEDLLELCDQLFGRDLLRRGYGR